MWMMGYNDGAMAATDFNISDSFNGRRLRHLVPRPNAAATTTNNHNTPTISSPYLSRFHGSDLLALNHRLAVMPEQSKKDFNTQQVVVSSRWNPTPEQLQALEDLYRRGTRTPSADQIQHITSQLRRYGKIEGKNVFYWFQNHKARERQKRRRQLESASDDQNMETTERKETAESNKTAFEVEHTKSWAPSTNCSALAENSPVLIQRSAKAAISSECRAADGWVQFGDGELQLQQRRSSLLERNATWHMMQLSSSSSPVQPIYSTTAAPAVVADAATTSIINNTVSAATRIDSKFVKTKEFMNNIFVSHNNEDLIHYSGLLVDDCNIDHDEEEESRTLQLFPIEARSHECIECIAHEKDEMPLVSTSMNSNFAPYQFFEFLPLKN